MATTAAAVAAAVVAKLEHPDKGVRCAAVKTLGKLPPEVLETHVDALVAKLEDSDHGVRRAFEDEQLCQRRAVFVQLQGKCWPGSRSSR